VPYFVADTGTKKKIIMEKNQPDSKFVWVARPTINEIGYPTR